MSGSYVLMCSCGDDTTLEQGVFHGTIEDAAKFAPFLEALHKDSTLDLGDLRGGSYEHASEVVYWVIDHWRHGEMRYRYDNNDNPPVALRVGSGALPAPCATCKGRRLVPCPACKDSS